MAFLDHLDLYKAIGRGDAVAPTPATTTRTESAPRIRLPVPTRFISRVVEAGRGGSGDPGQILDPNAQPDYSLDGSGPNVLPEIRPGGDMPFATGYPRYGFTSTGGGINLGDTGFGGIQIGPGGISAEGTLFGIPISGTLPFGGGSGGSEAPSGGSQLVASGGGECPGLFSVKVGDRCVNLGDLPPGGDPALTGVQGNGKGNGAYGPAVVGLYGEGRLPRVEVQQVRRCPPNYALGKDGVCYDDLSRNSKKRMYPQGMKPLMTPGERAAIRKAAAVAGRLKRSKKQLKKASKALDKAC